MLHNELEDAISYFMAGVEHNYPRESMDYAKARLIRASLELLANIDETVADTIDHYGILDVGAV